MKAEILALLRANDSYLSGQELCRRFGVSRTAVWKVINQLKEEGYEIEAVQNKGYHLLHTPDVLSESELKSRMNTGWAGKNLHFLKETGSTNIDAKRCIENGEPHGTLVVADRQTAGRGRRGRSWESLSGTAIYMTLALKPDFAPGKASMLTLVMALAVAEAVEESCGLKAMIKWPNDIVVNRKKVCGILTEMNMETDYIQSVVVGVGINVNQKEFPEEIRETATSLALEKGTDIRRAQLIAAVMAHFEQAYECFLINGDLSGLKEAYEARLVNRKERVRVLDPQGEYEGQAEGITDTGELLVRRKDGTVTAVYAGEVSVRGYYGYV